MSAAATVHEDAKDPGGQEVATTAPSSDTEESRGGVFGEFAARPKTLTAALAVLGKKNETLYFRLCDDYAAEKDYFESIFFVSIDVIEECQERKQQDMYLGFLCPVEEYQAYGYMTNTGIKFVVIIKDSHKLQETDLRDFFQKIHAAFVEHLMNPFVPIDTDKIASTRFDRAVDKHLPLLERPAGPSTSASSKLQS